MKYTISILLIVLGLSLKAQNDLERQVFVRAGIDLARFALPFINNYGPKGLEFSLDTEVKYRYFPTIEAGMVEINEQTAAHNYLLNGNYFRFGFDYNMINYKQRLDRNLFFVGARFGFTQFSHQANNISITNEWGTYETTFPQTKLNAQWFEGVIGIRSEIIKNFYMGFTIRVKSMVSHTKYENFTPYWVPGYGKQGKSIRGGISYSVFYAIPIKNPKLDFEK